MAQSTWIKYILIAPAFTASISTAEIYSWEDAESVHFTDNQSIVPQQNITSEPVAAVAADAGVQTRSDTYAVVTENRVTPAIRNVIEPPARPNPGARIPAEPAAVYKSTGAPAERNIRSDSTFPSLATMVVVGLALILFLFIMWIVTIADVVRSTFTTPRLQITWVLLVLLLPVVGMAFYYVLGLSQKCDPIICYGRKHHELSLTDRGT
jgi:hypothetical protein